MKLQSMVLAAAAGLILSGPVVANVEFYDRLDPNSHPILNESVLMGGAGLSATTIDIFTDLASWTGYTATLELLLSDDEAQPDGEHAVVAGLINKAVEIEQSTVARWYTWEGDVGGFLQPGLDSNLFFSESRKAQPGNKDFLYYNARLVFSVVPEASQWLLLGAGLLVAGGLARRSSLGP